MNPPRGAVAETRKEKALRTRRRMLRAAYDVFCEQGYAGATMSRIAKRAGVAVQTLYFTFHTKGALLGETLGATILGVDRWDPRARSLLLPDDPRALVAIHPWFEAFDAAVDARGALREFVASNVAVLARVAPLLVVTASAAASDEEVRAMAELGERRRRESYAVVVQMLGKKGGLRPELEAERTVDILLTLLSAETYHQLSAGRGWSFEACRDWLGEVVEQQLVG